ncbi:MAG: hypothetical protein COA84_14440 [Robiginitomaculum sp.]|nr:MAG: hypothetical protein COA84_14440 [Robiginitomaculum sp.]
MNILDDEIRKALSGAELEKLGSLAEEPGMFAMLFDIFKGKMRFWNLYGMVLGFAATGFALWAGWNFFHTSDPRMMTLWGVGMGVGVFFSGMLKLWFWLEMHKNMVIREIKRVELQLAALSSALRDKGAI